MGRCKQADHCRNPSWCTLTNSCLKALPDSTKLRPFEYTRDELDAAVLAERERWTAPVLAMLAAHDASLVRLGEMMRANGVTTIRIDGAAQAELDAIEALRGLVGPNRY